MVSEITRKRGLFSMCHKYCIYDKYIPHLSSYTLLGKAQILFCEINNINDVNCKIIMHLQHKLQK